MTSLITYPRTVGDLKAVIAQGYDEVMKLMRDNKLRVNLKRFLQVLFKGRNHDDKTLEMFNRRLLDWQNARRLAGKPDATMVYHHSGVHVLTGFTFEEFKFEKKADRTLYDFERNTEYPKIKQKWLKDIAVNHTKVLLDAGFPQAVIDKMARDGLNPIVGGKKYQVHHRKPLDDGGDNNTDNFILIRDDMEHRAVHGHYNPAELSIDRLKPGESVMVALPTPPADSIVYPNPAMNYDSERVANVDLLSIYDDH
ncbi:HNH endonuclease signature motif containing protein [Pseudomonas sp. NPDC089734]|uniref:HNH endonuclease signature motif containing protein n=1 Tax=Pseudomonas sp. NPDC089734 TaxID=3364469 RepID=UPI003806C807